MGCWNATCFLTRLPILHGEKIKLVLISERPAGTHDGSYATGRWSPLMLPLTGHYDDYGNIEHLADFEENKAALELLKDICFRKHEYEKEPVSIPSPDIDSEDFEECMQELIRSAVLCKLEVMCAHAGSGMEWAPVAVCMAKNEFWEHLVNASLSEIDQEYAGSVTFRIRFPNPFRKSLVWLNTSYGDDIPDNDPKAPKEAVFKYAALIASMDAMRIPFQPTCGDGSQDACEEKWQRDFHLKMWLATEELAGRWRWDGTPLPAFEKTIEWDGKENLVITEASGGCTGWKIDASEPTLVRPAVLECIAHNIRDDFQLSREYDEHAGYTAEEVL